MSFAAAFSPFKTNPLIRRALLALVACWLPLVGRAANEETFAFDLPGGDAVETLKRAARSGGVQVVFLVGTVEGVKTHPVQGRFRVREALDLMLANTGLTVVWDAKASAFSIERAPSLPPRAAQPGTGAAPRQTNSSPSETMKPNSRTLIAVLAGWIATAAPSDAQTAQPAVAPAANETVKLAAFVITGSNIPTAADALAAPVTVIN